MFHSDSRLIVGLGNPGRQYSQTRHNAGFLLIDCMLQNSEYESEFIAENALFALYRLHFPFRAFLMKPLTYMNRSGYAVSAFLEEFDLPLGRIAIVYDDLSLPKTRFKWRPKGSSGGQRGMQNIIDVLGTNEIPRLRLGIGCVESGQDAADYVLSSFSDSEIGFFKKLMGKALDSLVCWSLYGIEKTMSQYNGFELDL
ncbi:MAG: aminoacyl-tRNA hydrolase [Acidobacteria bacterium]|nr:MAG: aminoacyl-tRNA hydrolase [Acidobacteriota bacterium]